VNVEIHVAGCVYYSGIGVGSCIVDQLSESLSGGMCAF
jgi:hypothetical protein